MVRRLLLYVAALLLAPPAGTALAEECAPPTEKTVSGPSEMEKEASRIRGLNFKSKVDYQVVDRSEIQGLIDERLKEELPPDKLENIAIAYAKLGLIEPGVNLKEIILALYSEQIAAFYDQKKRKLYSIEGLPFSEEFQKVLMVHELTHALQDQNFDLGTLPLDLKTNDDVALAALSLVEGDATLVLSQYVREGAKLGLKDILASMTAGQSNLLEAPRVLRKNLMFPYMEGTRFVTQLYQKGGWEAVNRAYKDLPESTEQLMHPEKYLDERDNPVPITLPDFSSLAGKKWQLLEDNVLGELNTHILFTEFLGSIRAMRPSRGWGGDRFAVYRAEEGDQTFLVWATAWDTVKDREEFVSYYLEALKKKYKGEQLTTIEAEDYVSLTSRDDVIWLGWADKGAVVLEAPDHPTLQAMLWELIKAAGGPRFTGTDSAPSGAEK